MARLTFSDYKSYVRHSLGGGDPNAVVTSADVTKGHIVNQAGRYLFSMHEWSFKERPAVVDLLVGANESSVKMPYDFDGLEGVVAGSLTETVHLTTLQDIEQKRSNTWFDPLQYWVALVHPTQSGHSQGPPVSQLEIHPAPTASTTFKLIYRAGWIEMVLDTAVPNIPEKFEWLLIQLIKAFSEIQDASIKDKGRYDVLEAIERSSFLKRLKENDGSESGMFVRPVNGILQGAGRRWAEYSTWPYRSVTSAG